jgi:nucleotide-binding universal stress UspA family protein
MGKMQLHKQAVLERFIHYAVERNVPMYTKMVSSKSIADAIQQDVEAHHNTKLVLINRPERYLPSHLSKVAARKILDETKTNVGVMVDRGLEKIETVMVPVGGGVHSRLAIHLANDIAVQENAHVDYIRVLPAYKDEEYFEDEMANLQEIIITELGEMPRNANMRLLFSDQIAQALVEEAESSGYHLIISGISAGFGESDNLFGRISDEIAEKAPCSVLVVKRHQSATASWLRRQAKRLDV